MKIMVTGATGHYGRLALKYLQQMAPEAALFAMVRNPRRATALQAAGITVRVADYGDPEALAQALVGIDRLLLVSVNNAQAQGNVVAAAQAAGVQFIAYTSINAIEKPKLGLEVAHRATERQIAASGIAHTFLRNSWYLEVLQQALTAAALSHRFSYLPEAGKLSLALRREYAEAGARVIAGGEWPEVLPLAGKRYSFAALGSALQTALGAPLTLAAVSAQQIQALASQGDLSALYQQYATGDTGEDALSSTTFEQVLGHPLTPLVEAIRELQ